VSATGGASGNPVTFAVSGPATIVGSTVTITGAGLVTVMASQAGSANYLAAADVSRAFNVAKATQTISFGVLADKTFGEAAFDVSATGGASGNPVTFAVSGPATLVGSTVTITGAGVVTVTASQAGNANYLAAADVSRAFVVAKAAQTISFGVLADKTFGDAAFDVSATGGASGNPVTFAVSGPATIVGSTVTITGAGLVTVMASQAGSANYLAAADVSRSFAVAKATPVITWANPNDILSGTALSAAQLNASASVAGVFSYSPTFGTVPARGSNQPLNVSFTPSDFVNYNAGAASVSINVLNADPTLSSVSATPNPATTGSAVAFSAAASDIDADSLIYTWDFAEGSKASGPNASHTYSVPGTYAVVLSVSDGQGGTVSSTIPLVVSAPASAPGALDSDGDGFTDAIEAASGSSASSAIETPLGGAKSTNPLPLADAKLKIKLNFSKPGTSDAITLAGTLLLPDGFKLPGSKLLVDVGGVAKSFTLGATGSVKVGNDLAAVKSKGTSARTAKFVVKLSKGNFASTLAPMGLTSADANSTSVNVPLMIILGDVTFVKIHPQIYSAKTGKTGATKDRK
ncbi:MAG TPA: PKD domain-containing protein, partial [Planctomycetota bacterium]|nr:PKD domain-containing protein [Planctomycetota bacterium]